MIINVAEAMGLRPDVSLVKQPIPTLIPVKVHYYKNNIILAE